MDERRRFERVPFHCDMTLVAPGEEGPAEAHCCDIGLGGVGFASAASLPVGQVLSVSFRLDRSGREVVEHAVGRVVRAEYDCDANLYGLEFVAPLQRAQNPELVEVIERL